jgi:membrane-bound lytic murein transglycosylase B
MRPRRLWLAFEATRESRFASWAANFCASAQAAGIDEATLPLAFDGSSAVLACPPTVIPRREPLQRLQPTQTLPADPGATLR